jgi:hypothetical protein
MHISNFNLYEFVPDLASPVSRWRLPEKSVTIVTLESIQSTPHAVTT